MTDGVVLLRPMAADDCDALLGGRDEELERRLGPGDDDPRPAAGVVVGDEIVGWVDYDTEREWLLPGEVNGPK